MLIYHLLMAFAGFLDGLNDDWHDRFNQTSRVYRLFDWLHQKTGRRKMWEWYRGTRNGQPPMRVLFIACDYWHVVKILKKLVGFVAAPAFLFMSNDEWSVLTVHAFVGYCLEAATFILSYNYVLEVKHSNAKP